MMSRISFHGMACRISYRIGMFLLECDCEMVSGHCDTSTRGSVDNPSTRGIHVAIECLNATK